MSDFETRVTRLTHMVTGEAIFDERTTDIEIKDLAAGEFVVVRQHYEPAEPNTIQIDPGEWEAIKAAIDQLIKECRS